MVRPGDPGWGVTYLGQGSAPRAGSPEWIAQRQAARGYGSPVTAGGFSSGLAGGGGGGYSQAASSFQSGTAPSDLGLTQAKINLIKQAMGQARSDVMSKFGTLRTQSTREAERRGFMRSPGVYSEALAPVEEARTRGLRDITQSEQAQLAALAEEDRYAAAQRAFQQQGSYAGGGAAADELKPVFPEKHKAVQAAKAIAKARQLGVKIDPTTGEVTKLPPMGVSYGTDPGRVGPSFWESIKGQSKPTKPAKKASESQAAYKNRLAAWEFQKTGQVPGGEYVAPPGQVETPLPAMWPTGGGSWV